MLVYLCWVLRMLSSTQCKYKFRSISALLLLVGLVLQCVKLLGLGQRYKLTLAFLFVPDFLQLIDYVGTI